MTQHSTDPAATVGHDAGNTVGYDAGNTVGYDAGNTVGYDSANGVASSFAPDFDEPPPPPLPNTRRRKLPVATLVLALLAVGAAGFFIGVKVREEQGAGCHFQRISTRGGSRSVRDRRDWRPRERFAVRGRNRCDPHGWHRRCGRHGAGRRRDYERRGQHHWHRHRD